MPVKTGIHPLANGFPPPPRHLSPKIVAHGQKEPEQKSRQPFTSYTGGIGVTFLSDYTNSDTYYRLRRFGTTGSKSFHLSSHGTSTTSGTTDSGVEPTTNTWYRFKIEVEDSGTQTEIRAKIWEDGSNEPTNWQIDAVDNSGTRITSGTFGLWAYNGGSKYWDDLTVESLSVPEPTATPTNTPISTETPTPISSATPTNTPVPSSTDYTVTQKITLRLAGQPIAVRTIVEDDAQTVLETSIRYLLTDHLGSTSQMVEHTNNTVVAGSTAQHYPFGKYRTQPTNDDTDMGFTGHRHNDDIGLIYMNARFYSPYINRFLSADTIVPDPGNPQSYNRFSYVYNSPLNFNDPSGHCGADVGENAGETEDLYYQCVESRGQLEDLLGHSVEGEWTLAQMLDFLWSTQQILEAGIDITMQSKFYSSPNTVNHLNRQALQHLARMWKNTDKSSLEIATMTLEFAQIIYASSQDVFAVLSGRSGTGLSRTLGPSSLGDYNTHRTLQNRDSGFNTLFGDPDPDSNQVQHVFYYMQLTYNFPSIVPFIGNIKHEYLDDSGAQSHQDFAAGVWGINAGLRLKDNEVTFQELAVDMRDSLGK